MSLILAIEPDRRQVAQLISIVRHVTGAELVLADTTERALESIGNSVPDLILVPALLSPQDDAALAAALRVIATAAHVQMLTIPTFATAKARPKSRGMLSAFRRKPAEEAPLDGCDPKVFAEQISSYLERASQERAAAQLLEDDADAMAADSFAAPAQTFEELPAGFESADASAFDETSAEEAEEAPAETWIAATAPAEESAAPVDLVETFTAVEATIVAEPSLPVEETFEEPLPEMSIAAAPEQAAAPVELVEFVEVVETLEQTVPRIDDAHEEPLPEMSLASAPAEPAMALEEFAATLARTEPPAVVEAHAAPAMATAAIDENAFVELDVDLTTELEEAVPELAMGNVPDAQLPGLDELLADFERADLPVIEEVRAEQWMDATVETAVEPEEEEEPNQADIDASIELEAVLKPFEPVVPIERFEPFPLAAWQSWPRLEGTVSASSQDEGSDHSDGADSQIAEFEAALFEAVHQEQEALERFEPVVPVESLEPLPLAAWQCWPRLEGVMAEAYQEPITPRKAVARPEWVELMRSLREDIARRRAELSSPAPQPAQAPQAPQKPRAPLPQAAKPAVPAAAEALKKRPKRTRPIEDEWGLFDPEQCGFAALLDKLDEITVPPPSSNTRRQA